VRPWRREWFSPGEGPGGLQLEKKGNWSEYQSGLRRLIVSYPVQAGGVVGFNGRRIPGIHLPRSTGLHCRMQKIPLGAMSS
jgi:hypothetical protein